MKSTDKMHHRYEKKYEFNLGSQHFLTRVDHESLFKEPSQVSPLLEQLVSEIQSKINLDLEDNKSLKTLLKELEKSHRDEVSYYLQQIDKYQKLYVEEIVTQKSSLLPKKSLKKKKFSNAAA